jgi:hypothetical protein
MVVGVDDEGVFSLTVSDSDFFAFFPFLLDLRAAFGIRFGLQGWR